MLADVDGSCADTPFAPLAPFAPFAVTPEVVVLSLVGTETCGSGVEAVAFESKVVNRSCELGAVSMPLEARTDLSVMFSQTQARCSAPRSVSGEGRGMRV